MKITNQTFVTIIFNTEDIDSYVINKLHEIQKQISEIFHHYEIVVTCFSISKYGENKLKEFLIENNCLRILLLTNKVSNDAQLLSGLENAIGDYVVSCFEDKHSIRDMIKTLNCSINSGKTIFNLNEGFNNLLVKLKTNKNVKKRKIFRYCSIHVDGLLAINRSTLNLFLASGRMQDDIYSRIAKVSNDILFEKYKSTKNKGLKKIKKTFEYIKRHIKFIIFSSNNLSRFLTLLLIFLVLFSIGITSISYPISIIFIKMAFVTLSLKIWIFSEYIYRSFMKDSKISPYRIKKEYCSNIMNPQKSLNIISE